MNNLLKQALTKGKPPKLPEELMRMFIKYLLEDR